LDSVPVSGKDHQGFVDQDGGDEDERRRLGHPFKSLRLKEPTVDLRYIKGYVHTINSEALLAKGCKEMTNRMIYD
jgi:hypothetical protein